MTDSIYRAAEFSDDGRFRYSLERSWFQATSCERFITYVGLNPSTADAKQDDPTIRRLIGFTKSFGYEAFEIRNLYAVRGADPSKLSHADLQDFSNHFHLSNCKGEIIVCCWGNRRNWPDWERVVGWLQTWYGDKTYCFGENKDGSPKHPLYLKSDTKLQRWLP